MKKLLIATLFSLFAVGAQAGGLTTVGTLTQVNVAGVAQVKGTMTGNPDGCALATTYVLDEANPAFKNVLASLLTAYAAEKEIRFFVNGCISPGPNEYPEIKSVVLQ